VAGSRSLSQRISEGDGIAIIVWVQDADSARAAEVQGAKAVAVERPVAGIREATSLPLLWLGDADPADADAQTIRPDHEPWHADVEHVVAVYDEEELEVALERHDPEILLLSSRGGDGDEDQLDAVLELLPDVPAGKLAIAQVDVETRGEVLALERAGIDAVLVRGGDVAALVGARPPEV